MTTGAIICSSCTDLIVGWIGMEVMLLSFFPVVLSHEMPWLSALGSTSYFIVQSFSGGVYLVSCSMMSALDSWYMAIVVFLSLCLKLGCFPFQFWVPKVFAALEWGGCLMASVWQKYGPLTIVAGCPVFEKLKPFVIFIGFMSVLTGGLMGLGVSSVRVLMGWSSVTHSGWMLVLSMVDVWSLMKYFFVYAMVCTALYSMFESESLYHFTKFNSCNSHHARVWLSLGLLSLAGIPPLSGFSLKYLAITCLVEAGYSFLSLGLLVISGLMALAYTHLVFVLVVHTWDMSLSGPGFTEVKTEVADIVRLVVLCLMLPVFICL
uniref:NADH dehydrogenase subunit 2 n=1 Tax=Lingula reevii TaxID=2792136 RepID=UPI002E76F29C|nr:NADH dehydrogenase subunit 2 [Lingula reevii]WQG15348.1 NADH dehydrogenase subunit 2 [Lingula reevii]